MSIKIAHIQLLPLITGVQKVSLDELTRLDKNRYDNVLICQKPGPLTELCNLNGITCLYNDKLIRKISPINDLKAFWILYKLFKLHNFDIVHTHSSKTGVLGRLAAKLAGVPLIVHTVHGFAFPAAKNRFERNVFLFMEYIGTKCSHKIICLHEDDKNIAIKKLKAKDEQVSILANGVDINKFYPPTINHKNYLRSKFGLPETAIVIGMIGRLWKQKNPEALLTAAFSILKLKKDVHFIFAGDGEYLSSMTQLVKEKDLQNNIHFLGWRDDSDEVLKTLDIFTLPSLWEGMPLAILEAQATGLPCIVSNIQGNNSIVNNENGALWDLNNPNMYVDLLLKFIDDSSLRHQCGKVSLNNVLCSHNIDIRTSQLSSIYSEFLKNKVSICS
ncbi:glycosyltransferase family 4 protein [Photobacterium leiognathi]|uniref:glycosyltransferase family 4 protein n=1 Tax=Photobacterium leiognathi TaxID=553611 RepID=UPI0027376E70|nr:glycosyltransferase family 4 protein [Photobacterium leiognathi]